MACEFGSIPKSGRNTTQTVTLIPYMNPVIKAALEAAGYDLEYEINILEFCVIPSPVIVDIEPLDLFNLPLLYTKLKNIAEAYAWNENCACKSPAPPVPPPDDTPPQEPPENPLENPFPEFSTFACGTGTPDNGVTVEAIWQPLDGGASSYSYTFEDTSLSDEFTALPIDSNTIELRKNGSGFAQFTYNPASLVKYNVTDCRVQEAPEEPLPDFGLIDPCDFFNCNTGEGGDCLKQPDKADIISSVNLHSSESNNRIRDEIIDNLSAKTSLDKGDIAGYIAASQAQIVEAVEFNRTVIISRYEALQAQIEGSEQGLKDWIDGAKNQIISSVVLNAGAVLAGIATSTTAITTAITASTATITGAITTATTTLTTAINAARDNIKDRIKDTEDKVIEDLTKEVEKGRYRYRVLIVDITSFPTGLSYTVGRNGAPDKYAFGWIQWRRVTSGSNVAFTERQFICNIKGAFVSPFPNEDVTAVIHLQPSVSGTSMLIWSNNEFTE